MYIQINDCSVRPDERCPLASGGGGGHYDYAMLPCHVHTKLITQVVCTIDRQSERAQQRTSFFFLS